MNSNQEKQGVKESPKKTEEEELGNALLLNLPITTGTFAWTPLAVFLYIFLHCLSLMMPLVMVLTFFTDALHSNFYHWRIYFIVIDILAWWGTYLLTSLVLGKLVLILLKLIHAPKEGLFDIKGGNRDYRFYCLRVTVKKFIFWIWNNFCFPWVANMAYKTCDMRADFKSTMFDGWTDVEFIEFGNNMMIGQGAVVLSSMIIGDKLLIKKTIIGDHVVLGGNCVIAPGTIIGKGSTVGIWAVTQINQVLEPDWIYIGRPARKFIPTKKMAEESKKKFIRRIVDTGERIPFDINMYKRRQQAKRNS
ncbi:MAG: acyltransferase [Promethearchaeota archaeon]